ncbi:hypothetical protein GCM10027568_10980 [Humibacter soli]
MGDSGPTTAGSIRGVLVLDTSDWDEKIKSAELAAKNLARQNPTISIDVDDNGAVSKMAAVDAAAKALGSDNERLAQSTRSVNDANSGSAPRWALIAGAIAALAPLIAPLSGAVVGLAGAFAGLGAAGVLGVLGVVQAMKQGTQEGAAYSAGVKELKSDLDSLSSTAAVSLLGSFQSTVALIAADMPSLNSQVSWFSGQLGVIGTTTLRGVLNALQTLNPLFQQATGYVKSLADGFAAWTSNGGLQKFAQYAQSTFPQVTQALGSLAEGALSLVEALAPIGTVLLDVLTIAGQVITFLTSMGPAFSVVAGAAAAGFGAFKLWSTVGPIIAAVTTELEAAAGGATAFGIAIDAASGPIGWVIAGIGALTAAFAIGTAATSNATDATADYTAALQQSNGALDENVRKQAVKNLSDVGALELAKQFHVQLSTVTDAALGNKPAMDSLIASTKKYGSTLVEVHGYGGQVTNTYKTLTDTGQSFIDKVNHQATALKNQAAATRDQIAAMNGSISSVYDYQAAADAASNATDKFAQALQGLGQVNLSADQANIKYQQSLADTNAQIAKNGATLDESTQAGRDNASALDTIASSAIALISAEAKQGTSETQLQADMGATRAAFIKSAEAAGQTAQQANNLADKYGLIPKNVNTLYETSGAQDAINKAQQVAAALAYIPRYVGVTVSTHGTMVADTGHLVAFTKGGQVGKGHADGGFAGPVSGAGNAFNDQAGLYPLSDREFVVSDQFKQATTWAPTLNLMNAGASPEQVALSTLKQAGINGFGGRPQVVHNHYHTWNVSSNAQDPNAVAQAVVGRTNMWGLV